MGLRLVAGRAIGALRVVCQDRGPSLARMSVKEREYTTPSAAAPFSSKYLNSKADNTEAQHVFREAPRAIQLLLRRAGEAPEERYKHGHHCRSIWQHS